ncbi:MAG TPA: VOC family protein [Acidimicrobiales bacterium]|nr:VOC family protein [Acidimicrobiales bacterium]
MAKRTSYPPGTPSYVDIGSPDPDATAAFYSALFGWTINDLGPDAGGYRMAQIDGDDVAGIGPAQNPGPPYWTTYITVEDADVTAKKVETTGGTVLAPPFDVLQAGRMGVFADPNGAVFSVWQRNESIGSYRVNEHGALCWNELNTRNLESAKKFYGDVFDWTFHGDENYTGFEVDGAGVGGFAPMAPDRFPPDVPEHWLVYFAVDDVTATHAKIAELGGTTMMEPFAVPEVGTMTVAQDPQGATFAVIQLNEPGQ